MTNVIWDAHFYGWIPGVSNKVLSSVAQNLQGKIEAGSFTSNGSTAIVGAQSVTSKDGPRHHR
jgi:hypothetical protein